MASCCGSPQAAVSRAYPRRAGIMTPLYPQRHRSWLCQHQRWVGGLSSTGHVLLLPILSAMLPACPGS